MIPNTDVASYIRARRRDFENTPAEPWEGLTFNTKDILRQIDFYKNSRFLEGDYDEDGNELIFQNLVNNAAETAKGFQDVDEVDLQLTAVGAPRIKSRMLNKENQKLMQRIRMGQVLNKMTSNRVDYGGVFVRKRTIKGEVHLEIPDLKDLIFDQRDWKRDAIIQRSVISPAQLYDKKGVWDNAEEAIEKYHAARNHGVELSPDIIVYETFGYLPENFGKEDGSVSEEYKNKVVVSISFESINFPDADNAQEYHATEEHFVVYENEIDDIPFKYLPYIPVAGRTLGRGVIETGFMAQVATNRALYEQMDATSTAGKIFLQTASEELDVESLKDAPSGTIIRHEVNRPITNLNVTPSALPVWDNMMASFASQFNSEASVNPFTTGSNLPNRTSFKTGELMSSISTKSFDKHKKEMDIFLREIYQDWLIPSYIDNLTNEYILEASYTKEELDEIDSEIAVSAIAKATDEYIAANGVAPTREQVDREYNKIMRNLGKMGENRAVKIPKDFFRGINAQVKLAITNESLDRESMMSSLSSVYQVLLQNPGALQDEQLSGILNEMLEYAGLNTVRINRRTENRDNSVAAQMGPVSGSGSQAIAQVAQGLT